MIFCGNWKFLFIRLAKEDENIVGLAERLRRDRP